MTEVTPPPIQPPSSKERKYDRQLRLWGANGQAALEESHVLLLNGGTGVVGVETLKNLVLPGAGNFTILDPATVSESDLGVNFFLEDEDLGKSRAERCSHWLQELNPDVKGHHITQSLEAFFNNQDVLSPYTLVLAILPIPEDILSNLAQWTVNSSIPVFYIHSIGFYSHFTVQLPSTFPIVDTHPDPSTTRDLRLLEPWPELAEHLNEKTADMEAMDDEQHGHIPYVFLLMYFLEQWKLSHNGQPPKNYREKNEFRTMVKKGARTANAEGGEENFDEAAAAVLRTLNQAIPTDAVKEVFDAEECQKLDETSSNFWIIAHAIQDFTKIHGVLPLSGGLPDMKAKSADYVQLQNIYKSKARRDVGEVMARVQELERTLGMSNAIERAEIEAFCKGAAYVKLIRGRPPHLAQPVSTLKWRDRASRAAEDLDDPESLLPIYIAFLAYDSVVTSKSANDSAVGQNGINSTPSTNLHLDVDMIMVVANSIIDGLHNEAGLVPAEPEDLEVKEKVSSIITELYGVLHNPAASRSSTNASFTSHRAAGGELHNISAMTGGMVAQEAIKVISKQYIPIDNTCIFDGILSKTSVVRL